MSTEYIESEKWPFPWHRHNTRLLAANGNVVAVFPVDGEPLFGGGIAGVVERGDIIEHHVSRIRRRRNEYLEKKLAELRKHAANLLGHCDALVQSEGSEFNPGSFDSMKDVMHDLHEILDK